MVYLMCPCPLILNIEGKSTRLAVVRLSFCSSFQKKPAVFTQFTVTARVCVVFSFRVLCCFRHLSSLSGGRGLVLVGDKGYVSAEEMKGDRDPHIAYHGSLSCMVSLTTAKAAKPP